MKAVIIDSPGKIRLADVPVPAPAPGFARVKVSVAAVCATDLEILSGGIAARYPVTPGHEWSGTVDAVGDPADGGWLGKAVVGSCDVVCGKCPACRAGKWRYCESFEEIGFKRDGAYAQYVNVPVYGLVEKAENVSFEQAALCEPLGVALGTLKKARARFGQTLAIFGAGSIGLSILAAAKAAGLSRIAVIAASEKRLGVARELGAHAALSTADPGWREELRRLHPGGSDLIADATGDETCISSALKLLRKGGTLVLAGYGKGREMRIRMDDIHINNLRVVGAGNNWNLHREAMELMRSGAVDLSRFITARFRLEDYEKALSLAATRPAGFVKAVFVNE